MGAQMVKAVRFVGISASPRKAANTQILVEEALRAAEDLVRGCGCIAEVEVVSLAGRRILPCINCDQCIKQGSYCVLRDDWLELARPLFDPVPNGVIFGSPVYFYNQNSIGRAYMERFTSVLKKLWDPAFPHDPPDWSTTAAGAVAVGFDRHGGVEMVLDSILHWFLVLGFVVVGGFYTGGAAWTHMDAEKQAVKRDQLGLAAARLVGRRVAKTALLFQAGGEVLDVVRAVDTSWRSEAAALLEGGERRE